MVELFQLNKLYRFLCLCCAVVCSLVLWNFPVWAGGALKTNINGMPHRWDTTVILNPENGALKPGVYSNAASVALVEAAVARWVAVPNISLFAVIGTFLNDGGDTNVLNYKNFYNSDITDCYDNDPETECISPIIFDSDGSIIEDMFGECTQSSIVGFAGFSDISGDSDDPTRTILKRGYAVFSGACIAPTVQKPGCPPCNRILSHEEVQGFITHEMGHLLGLGHASVNGESYQACLDTGSCSAEVTEHIPTMHPFLVSGANMLTLHPDDVVSLQRLYGNPSQDHCSLSGRVLDVSGREMRGVEVTARNMSLDLRFTDAIAYVSGEEAPRIEPYDKVADNCLEDCGKFEIAGLKAGETYQLCVSRLPDKFQGIRSVGPVDPPRQDFDNDCLETQTFTCECQGGVCTKFPNLDIVAHNNGTDYSFSQFPAEAPRTGGCNLISPEKNIAWSILKRTFQKMGNSYGKSTTHPTSTEDL